MLFPILLCEISSEGLDQYWQILNQYTSTHKMNTDLVEYNKLYFWEVILLGFSHSYS